MIELLVVVSIIALLLAILMPSLRRAREQAKSVVCLSNLRAISTASRIYAEQDRQNMAVPVHASQDVAGFVGAYEFGGKAGVGEPMDGSDRLSSRWGTQMGRGPARRPLNDIMYKAGFSDYTADPGPNQYNWAGDTEWDLKAFRCPSDRGYRGLHYLAWRHSGLTSYDHYGTSYAANVFWVGPVQGECHMSSNSPYLRPLTRIPNPANTLYFEENVGRFAWMRAPDPCPLPEVEGVPSRVYGWHGRWWTFETAFADGHAESIMMNGYRPEHLSHYPANPMGFSHTFESLQCVIVRGSNWQKDTLPSPLVLTSHNCPPAGARPSTEGADGVGE